MEIIQKQNGWQIVLLPERETGNFKNII